MDCDDEAHHAVVGQERLQADRESINRAFIAVFTPREQLMDMVMTSMMSRFGESRTSRLSY
jgi:hypothetical protein